MNLSPDQRCMSAPYESALGASFGVPQPGRQGSFAINHREA